MKRNYKLSILEHPHGTYYIAKTFPGSNILYTGCLAGTYIGINYNMTERVHVLGTLNGKLRA